MIAVCSIACDRKKDELYGWPTLFELEGEYSIYFNYEGEPDIERLQAKMWAYPGAHNRDFSLDIWNWRTRCGVDWRWKPKFDQDQARLASIVCARNMCIDYAIQTMASHLLFIDADVIPPLDVIPKLLALDHSIVGGVVPGRGCHSHVNYIFGEEGRHNVNGAAVIEVMHGTCGCMMIRRDLFNNIRFRYDNDGGLSEDPAYCMDVRAKFDTKMWLRDDVVCLHRGELEEIQIAQY